MASFRPADVHRGLYAAVMLGRLRAASALALTAASLNPPTAARALALLLLLLCGALSVWRWGSRRRSLPADGSSHGSGPGVTNAAGTSTARLPHLTQDERMQM